ncbi:MAG: hypothetical protein H6Q78_751 [Candidatus Krumholzibacteriota bacterium]|nr:hypothetical protein [Candidatus Krumholzibacteriota bacterium]
MKLKVLVGALVFLIVLNLATIGTFLYMHFTRPELPPMADGPGFPPRDHASMRKPWLHRLPSENREALVGLLDELRSETEDLRTKMRDLEDGVFDLMQSDPVPVARVDSLLAEISHTRLEIARIASRKLIEAKGVLPPEEERFFFDAILESRPTPHFTRGEGQRRSDGRGEGRGDGQGRREGRGEGP